MDKKPNTRFITAISICCSIFALLSIGAGFGVVYCLVFKTITEMLWWLLGFAVAYYSTLLFSGYYWHVAYNYAIDESGWALRHGKEISNYSKRVLAYIEKRNEEESNNTL